MKTIQYIWQRFMSPAVSDEAFFESLFHAVSRMYRQVIVLDLPHLVGKS